MKFKNFKLIKIDNKSEIKHVKRVKKKPVFYCYDFLFREPKRVYTQPVKLIKDPSRAIE